MQIECEVFNLEVEDDHTYVANGVVVHNCLSCIALHGTLLPVGARVVDHWNGRCYGKPLVRGRPRPSVTPGTVWFDEQPEERQRLIAGAAAHDLLTSGKASLIDFVHHHDDPVFGEAINQASVKAVLAKQS